MGSSFLTSRGPTASLRLFWRLRLENGGEGGIRTRGTLLRFTSLAKKRFRPLSHFSHPFRIVNRSVCLSSTFFVRNCGLFRPLLVRSAEGTRLLARSDKDLRERAIIALPHSLS